MNELTFFTFVVEFPFADGSKNSCHRQVKGAKSLGLQLRVHGNNEEAIAAKDGLLQWNYDGETAKQFHHRRVSVPVCELSLGGKSAYN